MKHIFTILILFLTFSSYCQTFTDDFEAYPKNGFIAGNNTKWTTWSKMPNSPEDANVSEEFAKSGKQSAKIIGTVVDAGGTIDFSIALWSKIC
jgi:hypothetical protein